MGEGELHRSGYHIRHERRTLFVRSAEPQEAAAGHRGAHPRLQRQHAAEGFHDDHGLDRPAADAAIVLGEGQGKQTHLRVLLPHVAGVAFGSGHVALAFLETVAVGKKPLELVLQQGLFFGKIEIHGVTIPARPWR